MSVRGTFPSFFNIPPSLYFNVPQCEFISHEVLVINKNKIKCVKLYRVIYVCIRPGILNPMEEHDNGNILILCISVFGMMYIFTIYMNIHESIF